MNNAEDFSKHPKLFVENVAVAFNPEVFAMLIATGEVRLALALSPAHMRRLGQYITYQVAEYEKQFGPIHGADWSPHQPSPIQPPDLGKGI